MQFIGSSKPDFLDPKVDLPVIGGLSNHLAATLRSKFMPDFGFMK